MLEINESLAFIKNFASKLWQLLTRYRTKRHNYKHAIYTLKGLYGSKQADQLPRLKQIQSRMKKIRKNALHEFNEGLAQLRDDYAFHAAKVVCMCNKPSKNSQKNDENFQDIL